MITDNNDTHVLDDDGDDEDDDDDDDDNKTLPRVTFLQTKLKTDQRG